MPSFKADQLDGASIQRIMDAHTDVTGAVQVEIQTNDAKDVLWINVNGVCLLRLCQIQELKIDGSRWRKGWRGEGTN